MSCEIRVYDKDLNWLGIAAAAESVQWSRELYGGGGVEIHIEPTKPGAEYLLKPDNVIVLNRNREKSAIIEDFRIERSDRGVEAVIFASSALKSFASRRIIIPPTEAQKPGSLGYDRFKGTTEDLIRHYVKMHMIEPYDSKRKIPRLELEPRRGIGGDTVWQSRYKSLFEELSAMAEHSGLGIGIYPDVAEKKWVFELYEGLNRSRSQTALSPVSFKSEYLNIKGYRYVETYSRHKNTGYAGGRGENEKRLVYTIGADNEGLSRKECFLDCANAADAAELMLYGSQKLEEFTEIKGIEAEVLPKRVFIYESDYRLGDTVTIDISELGLSLDAAVTEEKEIFEPNTQSLELRLGSKALSLFTGFKNKAEIR